MTHHVDWLYVSDIFGNPSEIVNEARTAALLLAAGLPQFSDITQQACPALSYEPCSMDSSGAVTEWVLLDDDITAAPWYDASSPASSEGFGFYIEEWTGIDGAHHTREVSPRGSGFGGATFGPQTSRQRVMAFNLLAVGETERGLNHLFRWLESTLLRTCTTDGTATIWLREFCPEGTTVGDLEEGLCSSGEVVLIDGPTWVDLSIEGAGRHVRRLSFTLAAGDPCLRRPPGPATTGTSVYADAPAMPDAVVTPCGHYAGTSLQVTHALAPPSYGTVSAIVTISSPKETTAATDHSVPSLRIFALLDFAGSGVADPCGQPRTGYIILSGLPGGYQAVVDCGDASIMVRDLYGDANWVNGAQYIQPAAIWDDSHVGKRTINVGQCAGAFLVVEPVFPTEVSIDGFSTEWSVDIQSVERFGCGA